MTLIRKNDYDTVTSNIPGWLLRRVSLEYGCDVFLIRNTSCRTCDCGADDGAEPEAESLITAKFVSNIVTPLVEALLSIHVPATDTSETWCSHCHTLDLDDGTWPCRTMKLLNAHLNLPIPEPVTIR